MGSLKRFFCTKTSKNTILKRWSSIYSSRGYTLYSTNIDESGNVVHMAISLNIENLQFQYIGDFDFDGVTDVPRDWDNSNWTIDPLDDEATKQAKMNLITRIRMVRNGFWEELRTLV